jgi:hypothetical protein
MNEHTWQQMLVDAYPHLFVRSFRGVPFAPGYPTSPDGWRDIVIRLIERVSIAATGHRAHFTQISEKFGVLRIYWTAETEFPQDSELAIENAIACAEARSACTCAVCGVEGRLFSSGGWLLTACSDHARGVPVPVPSATENLHIVRGYVGEEVRVITCRRYDRARDLFIDIDPGSLCT